MKAGGRTRDAQPPAQAARRGRAHPARSSHHTAWAGVLGTAAELTRGSYDVALTLGHTPVFDLTCADPAGRQFTVQVKSTHAPNFVLVQRRNLVALTRPDLFFVVAVVPVK